MSATTGGRSNPKLACLIPFRRLDADAYLGVWLFTRNSDFYPGGVDARRSRWSPCSST